MEPSEKSRFSLRDPVYRDMAWAAIAFLAILALLISVDFVEWLFQTTRDHENLELDEWIASLVALAAIVAWYAYRRWRDSMRLSGRLNSKASELQLSNRQLSDSVARLGEEIARRGRAEAALNEARDAAVQASRTKSAFLAAASHDLRQPLHSMRLLLAALTAEDLPGAGRELADRLDEAVETMGRQLNSLLDITQLDAGVVKPNVSVFPAGFLLDQLAAFVTPLAEETGTPCRFVPCRAEVRSDQDLLYEILQNFLSNAIRHGVRRPVLVGCRRRGDELRFEVWDRGEGIKPGDLSSIFKAFYQVGTPQRDRDRGLGLGLAIAERLAKLLGHEIDVRSTPDRGTLFAVRVPLAQGSQPQPRPPKRPSLRKARSFRPHALIIEDSTRVARATARLLRTWGLSTQITGTGLQAVRAIRNGHARPDLIILDHQVQQRSGIALLKQVRGPHRRRVHCLMVTAHLTPAVRRAAEVADCTVMQKPVDPKRLREHVAQLFPTGRLRARQRAATPREAGGRRLPRRPPP